MKTPLARGSDGRGGQSSRAYTPVCLWPKTECPRDRNKGMRVRQTNARNRRSHRPVFAYHFFPPLSLRRPPAIQIVSFRGRPIRTPSIYNLPDHIRIKRRLFGRVVVYYYFKYTAIYYNHSTCSSLCCNRDCILSGQQFLPEKEK